MLKLAALASREPAGDGEIQEKSVQHEHVVGNHTALDLDADFGDEGLPNIVVLERLVSEGLDVKLYGGFHLGKRLFVRLSPPATTTPFRPRG